jgi:predicted regulator of Ras-like GTPase activity (Roadblock/LC7/MglB family)
VDIFMVSRLDQVLKELNDNGNFRASLFATNAGLVLASQRTSFSIAKIRRH